MNYTLPFECISKSDTAIAGGKGASLGEMTQTGIPVPPGFVILASTFETFLRETHLNAEIEAILGTVSIEVVHTVEDASEKIQSLILGAPVPQSIADEIISGWETLGTMYVAVRSSATAEDGAEHAWAGQLDSFLNTTKEQLLINVQRCWASLFTPRAIFYRFEKGLHTQHISVAVVVQKMVESEISGIAFTVHPVTEDRNQMIIEAGFGLGEAIVSGQITPDSYVIEKEPRRIIEMNVSTQTRALYRALEGGNLWRDIPEPKASSQVLSEVQILELSDIVLRIEQHYGFPCDIEWAYEAGIFYIVQSRPITTLISVESQSDVFDTKCVFEKRYSRESIMLIQQIWMQTSTIDLPERFSICGSLPTPSLAIDCNGGILDIWVNAAAHEWLMDSAAVVYGQDVQKVSYLISEYTKQLDTLHSVHWSRPAQLVNDLQETLVFMRSALANLHTLFYIILSEKTPQPIRDMAMSIRSEDRFFVDAEEYLICSLKHLYPDDHDLVPCILFEDLTGTELQKDVVKQRSGQFLFIDGISQGSISLVDYVQIHPYIKLIDTTQDVLLKGMFTGQIAYNGCVVGRVKIVKRKQDISTIQLGDVIVSPMTTPDFLPAMQKASAFVTDEGGITCHAAIVAREMKKPCVIGTKIATAVLKNGDLVEVDATNGIVTILSQNKQENSTEMELYQQTGEPIGAYQISLPMLACTKPMTQYFSCSYGDLWVYFQNNRITNLIQLSHMKEISQNFFSIAKDGIPLEWKKEWEYLDVEMHTCARQIRQLDLAQISNEDLWKYYMQMYDLDQRMWAVSIFIDALDAGFDQDEIHRIQKVYTIKNEERDVLLSPCVPAYITKFENTLVDFKEGNKKAEDVIEEYYWIGADYGTFAEVDTEWLVKRAQKAERHPFVSPEEKQKCILDSKGYATNPLQVFQDLGVWRDDRKILNFVGVYGCVRLLREGLRRQGVNPDYVNFLCPNDIHDVFFGHISAEYLEKRNTESILYHIHEDGSLTYQEGQEAQQEFKRLSQYLPHTDADSFKGMVACVGKARGRVCYAETPDSHTARQMQKGDILVTSMTRPEFVPLMRLAGAIVTDEGGISSHAAIVSRELKVPCVIGTKVATKVLKDGDIVEVDADNGIIKIIKKAV